ncbi:unnamed protein product, partial [Tenebrio molitor]
MRRINRIYRTVVDKICLFLFDTFLKSNFLDAFLNISLITSLDTAVQCKSTTTMFIQIILKVVIY